MFDVAPTELLLLGAVAIAVIPPKDLPRAMRFAGQWIGKARGMARHFRSGLDEMIRQAELDEIEKKWRDENERIMREHPLHDMIEHPDGTPSGAVVAVAIGESVASLPAPAEQPQPPEAFVPLRAEPPAPAPEETASIEPVPAKPPRATPASAAAVDDAGPELPLGLPPKQ